MARAYRMTPARRAALRKAQAASARKRRGSGKGRTKAPRSYKSQRRRQNLKTAAAIGAVVAVHAAAGAAGRSSARRASARRGARNRAHINSQVRRTTGTSPRVTTGARVAGRGPNSANRIFVGTARGSVSVRRRYH